MPVVEGGRLEKEGIIDVLRLMAIAARTAPKSWGVDDILIAVATEREKDQIAEEMEKIAHERRIDGYLRDADNVRRSEAVMLIGVRGTKSIGDSDCGACGFSTCKEFDKAEKREGLDYRGPVCLFKAIDLGIALGSAVKTASISNVDNRIMYRIGVAARRLKMLPEADVVIGIPVSAYGKNIYFDRKWKPKIA